MIFTVQKNINETKKLHTNNSFLEHLSLYPLIPELGQALILCTRHSQPPQPSSTYRSLDLKICTFLGNFCLTHVFK